jgi:hypothetical protein
MKGYAFVGCNTAGNHAFFVRRDVVPPMMPQLTPQEGFVEAKFRESHTESGSLAYLTDEEEAGDTKNHANN